MSEAAVVLEAVSFTYPEGIQALREVSFSVAAGESLGLVGASGAGKSTLLLLLNGVLRPQEGRVLVKGEALEDKGAILRARRRVGLLFQDPEDQLFMPTVYEDVAFGPRNLECTSEETDRRVKEALRRVGALHLAERPAWRLSAGEKQLAALASVLACEPEILVLDEPSSGLDPRSRRRFMALLAELPGTKILASHDLDLVFDLCSRVIVLGGGKVRAQGGTREMLTNETLLLEWGLEKPLRLQGCPKCGSSKKKA